MRCKDCTCDIYFHDRNPELDKPGYEVAILGKKITVQCQSSEGSFLYSGTDIGHGHFELECPEANGWAILHRQSARDLVLEGSWYENGAHGMWRIYLNPRSSRKGSNED